MPKIIRSSTVNLDSAQPIVVRAVLLEEEEQLRAEELARLARTRLEGEASFEPEAVPRDPEVAAVYASAGQIVDEMLAAARADAGTIVENAREETRKVLQGALKEGLEQGFAEGYAKGHEKGYADGLKELEDRKRDAANEIEGILDSLRIERTNIIRNMEKDVVSLVFDIVDKVLDMELDRGDDWIVSRVRLALKQLENDASAVVRVSRENLERVMAVAEPAAAEAGKGDQLKIVADDKLLRGDFVIDTPNGSIDAGIQTKRNRAADLLLERTP